MIDVNDYRERLEERFLAAGFVKLDTPVETEDIFYIAMDVDETVNFDVEYWDPTVIALLRAMNDAGTRREFYRLDVYYDDDGILCVTSSLGDSNGQSPDYLRVKSNK